MDRKPGNSSKEPACQAGGVADPAAKNAAALAQEPADALHTVPKQDGVAEKAAAAETCRATRQGGATAAGEEVFLRVYDLSRGAAKVLSKQLLEFEIEGIWHTSVEVYGNEYYFQDGLVIQAAGATPYGPYVERISLGHTDCSRMNLEEYFELSRNLWTPESYDLFENNCNNFSNYLADFLVQRGIPSHILELPSRVKESPAFKQLFGARKN